MREIERLGGKRIRFSPLLDARERGLSFIKDAGKAVEYFF